MTWLGLGFSFTRRNARSRVRRNPIRLETLEDRTLLDTGLAPSLDLSSLTINPDQFASTNILVRFDPSVSPSDVSSSVVGSPTVTEELAPNLYSVQVPIGMTVEQAVAAYSSRPGVLYAEPDFQVSIAGVPNDPRFDDLYALHNVGQTGGTPDADIDAVEAWDVSTGSRNIVVAVIDTGVDWRHPDLADNIWINEDEIPGNGIDDDGNGYVDDVRGWDWVNNDNDPMDDNGHGTHVAGTIGAIGNNGIGVAGVSWQVSIMPLKFLSARGSGSISNAIKALRYAIDNGADISNNSWGGGGYSQAFKDVLDSGIAKDHLFVAAAGNANNDNDARPSYPASYTSPNVIAVAASDDDDLKAGFSNYGATSVDLFAPGVGILSTVPGNRYSYASGTSMAAPHVAGAAAVIKAYAGGNWQAIKNKILDNVDVKPQFQGLVLTGGRLNLFKALDDSPPPDQEGPHIVAHTPTGDVRGPVSTVEFTFSEDVTNVSVDDVIRFVGPGGADLTDQITDFSASGNQATVTFASQNVPGFYSLTVGPDITDAAGNPMDQDRDGTNGEVPDDQYTATFRILASTSRRYDSDDVPKRIRDRRLTRSKLYVPDDILISDVNVQFYITHTWDSDLRIWLKSPSKTKVMLVYHRGGHGDDFGTATEDTVIDDEADTPIHEGTAPFLGEYKPEWWNSLAAFDGESSKGTWKLFVYDRALYDTGTLWRWSLRIEGNEVGGGGGAGSSGADHPPVPRGGDASGASEPGVVLLDSNNDSSATRITNPVRANFKPPRQEKLRFKQQLHQKATERYFEEQFLIKKRKKKAKISMAPLTGDQDGPLLEKARK